MTCVSCGAQPIGIHDDGGPRYPATCRHTPVYPGDPRHPGLVDALNLRVTLDESDQKWAARVARTVAKRYREGKTARMKYLPAGRSIEDVNRDGFGAELAVARWSGEEWHRGLRKLPDVGADIEVRTVRRRDGMLALYTYDHGDRRYVFTIGSFPTYHLIGWIPGREGMTFDYFHPKGSIVMGYTLDVARFLVPVNELYPMKEFRRALPEAPEAATTAATAP